MLFRPVYLKGKKMQECLVPQAPPPKPEEPPPPPTPPPPAPPEPEEPEPVPEPEPEEVKARIPMLVCGDNGVKAVFPKEATRDVLAGRVDYYLLDERGVTLLERKHLLTALKLNKEKIESIEDYSCIGGHLRMLEKKPVVVQRKGLGYRRRYISPELIGRGIYGSDGSWGSARSQRTMSSGSLYRGYTGPRA